jgi:hypothetical protein
MPSRSILVATVAILAATLALPATAQSRLDRMEALSERANTLLNEALVAQLPQLAGNLPDPAWDGEMRSAFSCVLDAYVAEAGGAEVDAMLDRMDVAVAQATPETMLDGGLDAQVGLPAGLDEAESVQIMNECGVVVLMMQRMTESGAMQIMMDQ